MLMQLHADELRALLIVVVGQSSDEWKTDLALSRCTARSSTT